MRLDDVLELEQVAKEENQLHCRNESLIPRLSFFSGDRPMNVQAMLNREIRPLKSTGLKRDLRVADPTEDSD